MIISRGNDRAKAYHMPVKLGRANRTKIQFLPELTAPKKRILNCAALQEPAERVS